MDLPDVMPYTQEVYLTQDLIEGITLSWWENLLDKKKPQIRGHAIIAAYLVMTDPTTTQKVKTFGLSRFYGGFGSPLGNPIIASWTSWSPSVMNPIEFYKIKP